MKKHLHRHPKIKESVHFVNIDSFHFYDEPRYLMGKTEEIDALSSGKGEPHDHLQQHTDLSMQQRICMLKG